jgi:Cys-rich protein (TIGR01571 family)
MGSMYRRTGECVCQCCIPCSQMTMRAKLRTGFRIQGSLCRDCVASCCCPICTALQMYFFQL